MKKQVLITLLIVFHARGMKHSAVVKTDLSISNNDICYLATMPIDIMNYIAQILMCDDESDEEAIARIIEDRLIRAFDVGPLVAFCPYKIHKITVMADDIHPIYNRSTVRYTVIKDDIEYTGVLEGSRYQYIALSSTGNTIAVYQKNFNDKTYQYDLPSIGSNDLTQTTMGIDRDSELISAIFDERDLAVKRMLVKAIKTANKIGAYIGICGQAPSDFPDLADFLIKTGINSLSLTPDTVIPFLMRYAQ